VTRLDRRLRALNPELSWARLRAGIEGGQVLVDGIVERDPGHDVSSSARIAFDPSRPRQPHARLDLPRLYEDEDILVIDKPAGLLTIATDSSQRHTEDTVLRRAQDYVAHLQGRRGYAGVLHRLDRETSGALAIALSREAHAAGRELFSAHAFERRYLALVEGVPGERQGTIDAAVSRTYADGRRRLTRAERNGRWAVTHYSVRETFGDASLLELKLETGRQHQIRLHLERLGFPLIGETVYVGARKDGEPRRRLSRQMLHAWRLEFPHPLRGTMIKVEAPLPPDFAKLLRQMRTRKPLGSSRRSDPTRGQPR
jgi:23S rRNA pseudouridine1911/1915/1917 synthase